MYRFEYVDDVSAKFWEIEQVEGDLHIRWGRIGTAGQSKTKSYEDKTGASMAMFRLVREKTAKGYIDLELGDAATGTVPQLRPQPAPATVDKAADAGEAPPATPSTVAPWLAQGEPLRLDGAVRKRFRPTRRHPHPVDVVDPHRAWQRLRAAFGARITPDFADTAPALREAVETLWRSFDDAVPHHPASVEVILIAMCVELNHSAEPGTEEHCIDFLIAQHGLVHVIGLHLAAMQICVKRAGRSTRVTERAPTDTGCYRSRALSDAEWRLRAWLAAAPQDVYATCAANVDDAIAALAPECQIALALLFPDRPAMSHGVIDRLIASDIVAIPVLRWLQFTATDDAALARARSADRPGYFSVWDEADVNTILLEHGVDAVRWLRPYVLHPDPGDALTRIGTPEALAALILGAAISASASNANDNDARATRERLMLAVDRWPAAAMAALARHLGEGGEGPALLTPILLALMQRCPDLPRRLQSWLDPVANAVLDATRAHLPEPVEVATNDDVRALVPALHAMLDDRAQKRPAAKRVLLPEFWQPAGWRRPVLHDGKALPDAALDALGTPMLSPDSGATTAVLDQLKAACTAASLADFAWDCFSRWLTAAAPPKYGGALTNLGLFGLDDTARKLTPLIRAWPGEAAHVRAVKGLDVLAAIGSDVALMLLNGIAQSVAFKGLQDQARERILSIARARGLSREELEDRLVPDLGLDEGGSLLLDFGPRSFTVGFDESLKPHVRAWQDGKPGARLPDLPAPKQTDDAGLASQATERFKLLKKDARTVAGQQVLRLERAMCARRRWRPDVFAGLMAQHPLVRHLVRRLVWGVYTMRSDTVEPLANDGGTLLDCFRVADDGAYTTGGDDPFAMPEGAQIRIGLPHALELPAAVAAAFGQLLTDYELVQPFPQLGRDTHALTEDERGAATLLRWQGITVPTGKILGLSHTGWRRGPIDEGGLTWMYEKALGGGQWLALTFEPGIVAGSVETYPEQTLGDIMLGPDLPTFDALDPIAASELIRDIERLCA